MGNLHRIQWIDGRIRAGQHPDFEDPVLLTHRQLDLALQLRRKVVLEYVDARHRTSIRKVETLRLGYVIPEGFRPELYLPRNPLHQRTSYQATVRFPAKVSIRSYPHAFHQLEDSLYQFDFQRSDDLSAGC